MDETQSSAMPPATARDPELTPRIEQALARYVEIQEEMRALQEEKDGLRDMLVEHLAGADHRMWFPVVRGDRLRVRYANETVVDYNSDVLRQRLGDRYARILDPDLKKIRRHLREIEPCLAPVIETIGSVSRDKVRDAIEDGVMEPREFAGAFEKRQQSRIAVARLATTSPPAPTPDTTSSPW